MGALVLANDGSVARIAQTRSAASATETTREWNVEAHGPTSYSPRRTDVQLRRSRPLRSSAMPKKYKEVRKALLDAGWTVVRQQGSHEVWAHADRRARIVVAGKDTTRCRSARSVAFDEQAVWSVCDE
jgi:predicted RNA binding protein YcfA (HicA-like mRNA interferase family)